MNDHMQKAMRGAWILSFAALIAKILSAVYRVPFQNMVGDTGFYVYQQVYPLYGIGMTFALTGFPLFISKLVAEAREPDKQLEVAHRAHVLMCGFGVAAFLVIELGAGWIARLMADVSLTPIVRSVGVMFLTMPLLSTGRGYFQGTFDMGKTALSQVIEQIVRVAIILLAAWWAVGHDWSPYRMGTWAMSGAFFGGLAAMLVILPAYWRRFHGRRFARTSLAEYTALLRRFLREGGSIALFATLLIMMQLIDSFTVTRGLQAQGIPFVQATVLKGIFDRGQPLVQLGLVAAGALSTAVLPPMTRALSQGDARGFRRTARELIHFNLSLSLAAAAGLIALMPSINWLLFGDTAGTRTLRVYALSIILVAMINAYNSVLQSLNRYRITTFALLGGFVFKLFFNQLMVAQYGTLGAALTTVFALAMILVVLYFQLPSEVRSPDSNQFELRLAVVVGLMSVAVYEMARHVTVTQRVNALWVCLAGVGIGLSLFVLGASLTRLYTPEEVAFLPFGKHLRRLFNTNSKEK